MCLRVRSLPGTVSRKSQEPSGINTYILIGDLRFTIISSTLFPRTGTNTVRSRSMGSLMVKGPSKTIACSRWTCPYIKPSSRRHILPPKLFKRTLQLSWSSTSDKSSRPGWSAAVPIHGMPGWLRLCGYVAPLRLLSPMARLERQKLCLPLTSHVGFLVLGYAKHRVFLHYILVRIGVIY